MQRESNLEPWRTSLRKKPTSLKNNRRRNVVRDGQRLPAVMPGIVEYLYDRARQLRALVASEPQIQHDLLRIAQELDAIAAELEQDGSSLEEFGC
jgi:hypothetical protein